MSEQRPGEQEAYRPGRATEDGVEGHGIRGRYGAEGTDEPPDDDSEGHGVRWGRATDDEQPSQRAAFRAGRGMSPEAGDSEGHGVRVRGSAEGTDEPVDNDTEGHRRYSRVGEGADEPPSDEGDA